MTGSAEGPGREPEAVWAWVGKWGVPSTLSLPSGPSGFWAPGLLADTRLLEDHQFLKPGTVAVSPSGSPALAQDLEGAS